MANLKTKLKHLFYVTGTVPLLDRLMFRISYLKKRRKNLQYKKANPQVQLPPAYFLYETYVLDYQEYIEDGERSAKEIVEWTGPYLTKRPWHVLEWGCGVGRIIRHLGKFAPPGSAIHGCDVNEAMIQWNASHIEGVSFTKLDFSPPTPYPPEVFDLIFGISVFTHIDVEEQEDWLKEMHRIMQDGGIFLFTTHGRHYLSQLTVQEQKVMASKGAYTRIYQQKGHRMMTSYHSPDALAPLLENYFDILEFYDGAVDKTRTDGQDLWVVRKKLYKKYYLQTRQQGEQNAR